MVCLSTTGEYTVHEQQEGLATRHMYSVIHYLTVTSITCNEQE